MAFQDRIVQYPGRVRLTQALNEEQAIIPDTYDMTRAEGTVTRAGTPLNAANLNAEIAAAVRAEMPDIQYGRLGAQNCPANAYTDFAITFPRAFNGTPVVTVTIETNSTGVTMGSFMASAHSRTTTGFTLRVYNNTSTLRTPALMWIAVY